MTTSHRIFISCASHEFRSYRESLRQQLTTAIGEAKVQEDFINSGGSLLEKLDDYIRHSSAVLHLVGDWAGSCAQPAEVQAILQRYPQLPRELPELQAALQRTPHPLSYTQWECYLALLHNIPCHIYIAEPGSVREPGYVADAEHARSQADHLARLVARGKDRQPLVFQDAKDVALSFWKAFSSSSRIQAEGLPHPLAASTPGNIQTSQTHFVGRQTELGELHRALTAGGTAQGGCGMIVATFSPGGLGKTALARQYAQVHAPTYVAGGIWELGCEGAQSLGTALLRLADEPHFLRLGEDFTPPIRLELSQAQRQDDSLAARAVMAYLETIVTQRGAALRHPSAAHTAQRGPEPQAGLTSPAPCCCLTTLTSPHYFPPTKPAPC